MTNEQKKFLKVQLQEAYRLRHARLPKRWPGDHGKEKPADVRKAEAQIKTLQKTVRRWEKKIKDRHEAATRALDAEHREALSALLFNDPKVALAAVEKFRKRA